MAGSTKYKYHGTYTCFHTFRATAQLEQELIFQLPVHITDLTRTKKGMSVSITLFHTPASIPPGYITVRTCTHYDKICIHIPHQWSHNLFHKLLVLTNRSKFFRLLFSAYN